MGENGQCFARLQSAIIEQLLGALHLQGDLHLQGNRMPVPAQLMGFS
jgi:hypothetical protein